MLSSHIWRMDKHRRSVHFQGRSMHIPSKANPSRRDMQSEAEDRALGKIQCFGTVF